MLKLLLVFMLIVLMLMVDVLMVLILIMGRADGVHRDLPEEVRSQLQELLGTTCIIVHIYICKTHIQGVIVVHRHLYDVFLPELLGAFGHVLLWQIESLLEQHV
jgi:inner membrane protein involved in colicin E2 resistance